MGWGKFLGYIVLFVGFGLLVLPFFIAFGFLDTQHGNFRSSSLIEATIKAVYLGFMAWVGSLVTIRAVQTIRGLKR